MALGIVGPIMEGALKEADGGTLAAAGAASGGTFASASAAAAASSAAAVGECAVSQ